MTQLYRMPAFATLAVKELSVAARWYREALGFWTVLEVKQSAQTPGMVHLRRGTYQDLPLVPNFSAYSAGSGEPGGGVRLTFRVEEDLDVIVAKAKAAGARIVEGPTDKPWNAREVTFQDLDGYHLTFSRFSWVSGVA